MLYTLFSVGSLINCSFSVKKEVKYISKKFDLLIKNWAKKNVFLFRLTCNVCLNVYIGKGLFGKQNY